MCQLLRRSWIRAGLKRIRSKPVIAPIPVDTTKTTSKLAEATPDRFVVSCHVLEIVFVREV
jgi:hypothetical protein